MMKYLLDLSPEELRRWIRDSGEKPYHASQILKAVYSQHLTDFSAITELSKNLREKLQNHFFIYKLIPREIKTSVDGTIRLKYHSENVHFFTVFIPAAKHNSVCVSCQVGCRGCCLFCASGRTKFVRNLTAGEIVEQVFHTEKIVGQKIDRVLFMGMGEPLDNWENVSQAIANLVSPELANIGARNITISTVGVVGKISRLPDLKYRIPLAFSLHTADYKLRRQLVPVFSPKTAAGLRQLLLKIGQYSRKTRTELTIEYILISGFTDTPEQLEKLLGYLKNIRQMGVKLKINLIPYNQAAGLPQKFQTPEISEIEKFQNGLKRSGFLTIIRKNRGGDIGAACGQLGFGGEEWSVTSRQT